MVRPKASKENLHIATSFADAVTTKVTSNGPHKCKIKSMVDCRGQNSLFEALKIGIPDLVRTKELDLSARRQAVSEIELNKFLVQYGYVSFRSRRRIQGDLDKWSQGIQRWKNIRWINPRNIEESNRLRSQLANICASLPDEYPIMEDNLLKFLFDATVEDDEDWPVDPCEENADQKWQVSLLTSTACRSPVLCHPIGMPTWSVSLDCN